MSALDALLPTLPRSSSLYVSDAPRTVPLLDTSSYSPFPTFPGTLKASDPYGLNTFLLHPEDALWNYVDPIPDPLASTASGEEEDEGDASAKSRPQTVRKQKSLGLLRPSPLSQPPMAADETGKPEKQLGRKRSLSMGGETRLSPTQQKEVVDSFRVTVPVTPVREKSKLKKAFALGRKTGRKSETTPPVLTPPVPIVPTLSLAEDDTVGHPVTPLSTRSSSNSTLSSASSTCSSDDIKTPAEGQPVEVMIEGKALANALEEKSKKKGRSVWGWLGGRKIKGDGSQVSPRTSAKSTPSSSTADLLTVPQSSPPQPKSQTVLNFPSNQYPVEHTYLTNQLRASSLRKIAQLKAPSPHPFALALARQHRKLPDEVALSIQSGRRVFPKSVNSFTGLADLSPAQGGLRLGLAVRDVMIKLDRGEQPQGTIMARRNSRKNLVPRPKGVLDFINRPPFEQRNFVYFPDGVYSPISMARPGYGVWELDFSAYIQGLGELHEVSSMRNVERESKESFKAVQEERIEEAVEEKEVEGGQDQQAALMALIAKKAKPLFISDPLESPSPSSSSPCVSSENLPFSSFHPTSQRRISQSSDDEDDEPLSLTKRRSQLLGAKPSQPSLIPSLDTRVHNLSQAQATGDPASKRPSCLAPPPIDPQAAMLEVQRARERRELNRRGENEKRAEAERLMEKMKDRNTRDVSMMDLKSAPDLSVRDKMPQHKRASSSGSKLDLAHLQASRSSPQMGYPPTPRRSKTQPMPTAQAHDGRRRSVMSLVDSYPAPQAMLYAPPSNPGSKRPEITKAKTGLERDHSKSRFHSFYEQRGGVISTSSLNRRASQVAMVQPLPQDYLQQGVTRGSMVFGYGVSGMGVGTGDKRSSRMA